MTHKEASPQLRAFLWQQGFAIGAMDVETLIRNFHLQMSKDSRVNHSLAMLPSYLHLPHSITMQHKVIAIDAGGSNLRCALIHFEQEGNNIKSLIESESQLPMPGSQGLLSKQDFFAALFKSIESLLEYSDTIGFCFSYPCEISAQLDGKLLRWTKEVNAPEVEACWIGEELNRLIEQHGHGKKRIVLLNDTVSTLLASHLDPMHEKTDASIGLILGTGTNCAFSEYHDRHIINIESGAYDGVTLSPADQRLDKHCAHPGDYQFEKKISGKYLGDLCLQLLLLACEENLFSTSGKEQFQQYALVHQYHLPTTLLNDALENGQPFELDGNDLDIMQFIVKAVIERAALLSAMQLSAIGEYQREQKQAKDKTWQKQALEIMVNAEGSTFHELADYKQRIVHYLHILNARQGNHFHFIRCEKSSLLGAAIAALGRRN